MFLVLEYLEGETLDDRLTHGALPAYDVLRTHRRLRARWITPTAWRSSIAI